MFYGNMSLQLINEFEKLKLKFDNTNYDKNINLEYNEPSIYDIIKLNNYCNQYDDETRINIAEEYDNPTDIFINRYISNNQNTIVNQIDKYLDYILDICNYYVLKYKIKFNAPRPFQLAHKFKVDLYPVGLNTVHTPSYPSGHAMLYCAYYKFFSTIDKYSNYDDIIYNGLQSRIIGGIHFQQDNEASEILVEEIFKNDPNLKIFY